VDLLVRRRIPLSRVGAARYYLTIAVVSKNESSYLPEWIEYHTIVGVEHFFLYDNDSGDDTMVRLAPFLRSGLVTYSFRHGKGIQVALFNDALARYGHTTVWMAFIDVDEFLVPVIGRSISHLLKRFEYAAAVAVNWLIFSHSNQERRVTGLVIERFREKIPDHAENSWCKLIVQPDRVVKMTAAHFAIFVNGSFLVTTHHTRPGRDFYLQTLPMDQNFHDVMRINHYVFKSKEEFVIKRRRGGGVHGPNWRKWVEFYNQSVNKTSLDHLFTFYVPLIKSRLQARYNLPSDDTSLWWLPATRPVAMFLSAIKSEMGNHDSPKCSKQRRLSEVQSPFPGFV
jgi:hypothetical protein